MSTRVSLACIAIVASLGAGLPPAAALAGSAALELISADRRKTIELSLDGLQQLPQTTILTENEFADGMVAYRGPLVRDVLAQLGIENVSSVRFIAANDYFVDIPMDDFVKYDAILAMEADGRRLARRDKGPLWLMYPLSDFPELQNQDYLRRLIWQVVRIEAL